MFVQVTGTNFVRDTNSMGLSNTNTAEKNEYYAKVKMIQNQKENLNIVNQEITAMKSDMLEIKAMLAQLINKQ